MAISVICCYFLPFLFFLLAPMAFPGSIGAFLVGIAGISISSLILYLQSLSCKETKVVVKTIVEKEKATPIITVKQESSIKDFAIQTMNIRPTVQMEDKDQKIASLRSDLNSQKELFLEELEALKDSLTAKEETLKDKEKEIEDLKFELYTLLRIEKRSQLLTTSL